MRASDMHVNLSHAWFSQLTCKQQEEGERGLLAAEEVNEDDVEQHRGQLDGGRDRVVDEDRAGQRD